MIGNERRQREHGSTPTAGTTTPCTRVREPLAVDLDGTLVHTDTLLEALLAMVHRKPLLLLALPLWLLRGLPYLKQKIAHHSHLDVRSLPYNQALLEYLAQQRRSGRTLILATASHRIVAKQVADYLGIFDGVIATSEINVKGSAKAVALVRACPEGYSYAGDSGADVAVWAHAKWAVLVDVSRRVRRRVSRSCAIENEFTTSRKRWRQLFRALRPHQWVKNLLVALPLLTAHAYHNAEAVGATLLAFIAMCSVASSIYIVNDLMDLPDDRLHRTKRARPLAAGKVGLGVAILTVPGLWLIAVALCWHLPVAVAYGLLAYAIAAILYSFRIKRVAWLDVAWLAALYTLRIVIGALALQIPASGWLLAYSIAAFASLALLKRYVEISALANGQTRARGYYAHHELAVERAGWATTLLSGLVFVGYSQSQTVASLYSRGYLLLGVAALLTSLLAWVWRAARNGKVHDDPVAFAVRQPVAYTVLFACLLIVILAR